MRDQLAHRKSTRWVALAGAVIMMTATMVAVHAAAAAPASAVPDLHKEVATSATNSVHSKSVRAWCPTGERIAGGGGWVFAEDADDSAKVTLTQLQPVDATRDYYEVRGQETTPTMITDWWVEAYAICAPDRSLPGHHIVSSETVMSSKPVQVAAAGCLSGQVVLGTGGRVTAGDQVALQVARASASGDIARVQGHADADGYAEPWSVVAYAVCVNRPAGYEVVTGISDSRASEDEKSAFVTCPANKRVHSAGAAITDTAPGHVSLQQVYPNNGLRRVDAFAVENTPLSQNWDFIVVRAICAY